VALKFFPLITTDAPIIPEAGAKDVISGGAGFGSESFLQFVIRNVALQMSIAVKKIFKMIFIICEDCTNQI